MKQPKSFREAEKMARLAFYVENTMNSSRENSVAAQIGNLSQTVKSLLSAGVTPNAQSSTDDKKLLTVIEQNNALLANLSTALAVNQVSPSKIAESNLLPKIMDQPQWLLSRTLRMNRCSSGKVTFKS